MSPSSTPEVRGCCEHSAADRDVLDTESSEWLDTLCADGGSRDDAVRRLHELMLRAARWQAGWLRHQLPRANASDLDELAQQAADDATVAVLDRLPTYAGRARFTTWAYKFAILHTSVAVRKEAWRGREVPVQPNAWPLVPDPRSGPEGQAEAAALAAAIRTAVADSLTPHQRTVLVALAINDVPVDVLADRLSTTRGALYKTLHDARARVRSALVAAGFDVDVATGRSAR